jgi:hypothetical protein
MEEDKVDERNCMHRFRPSLTGLALAALVCAAMPTGEAGAQVRAALVKEVDVPARQAVMIRRNTSSNTFENVFTVPAGKRLVVEEVNCSALGTDPVYVGLFVTALAHANIVYSAPPQGSGATVRIFGGPTRVYFEPGTSVFLRMFTGDNTTCTIAGYTVDVAP